MGSITGNAVYYQWSPFTGLNNAFILNPTATISGPITYTLRAYGIDPANPNLVVNGNFSGGNTGFNSDYNYVVDIPGPQNEMVPEGTYTVINNPNLVHTGFAACTDHTGGGNMMVINGAADYQDIWCQTVTVNPDAWYNVAAWVASVNSSSPAELQFSINDIPIGPIVNASATPCLWVPFNATWNSGASTTAEICILNLNTALGGNDFALDDIAMYELCIVEDEVEITLYDEEAPEPDIDGPAFLCEGETGVYSASFPPDPPIYAYNWSVPSGATIISGQGTPEITIAWNEAQEYEICLEIETRCDQNEACFDVTIGTLPEFPLITGPTSLCPGQTATFYTPENNPGDQYEWIVPSSLTVISGEGTNEIEVEWTIAGEAEICLEVTNDCGTTDNCTLIDLWNAYSTLFDTVICEGTTIIINGNTYGNGLNTGVEVFTSIHGCDSIVEIEITEATALQFFDVVNLCPGDSVFLEGAYQTEQGTYVDSFLTTTGCDSLVITEIHITPFDTTWITLTSCSPADTGTTVLTINQGNCDSTIITTVSLSPSDTTHILLTSCLPADTGVVVQLLSNQYGCDSLVMITTQLAPTDTTELFASTCDPANVGVIQQLFTNVHGCDSLVILTTSFLMSDTTLLTGYTCSESDTGTTSILLSNSMGCDSLVITKTQYAGSDTTFLSGNTCFAADSGLLVTTLVNQFGCDSVISIYSALLSSDTTYLTFTTCSPLDTGVVNELFINQSGCDSLVVSTTTLNPIEWCSLEANLHTIQPLCFGQPGVITVNAIVGLPPFTVFWKHSVQPISDSVKINNAPGTQTLELITPGVYYFEVFSANGLFVKDTILVADIPPLEVKATTSTNAFGYSVPCFGDTNGMAEALLISPGTSPYIFTWSNGANSPVLTNLGAGTYIITVTDNNGCVSSSTIILASPAEIDYELQIEDVSCFGQNDGNVSVLSLNGGVPPWTTSLDGGLFQNQLIYTNLRPGAHSLLIRDQVGCEKTELFSIVEPAEWSLSLGPDTIVAFGSSIEIKAHITGQPMQPIEVHWSDEECEQCLSREISPGTNMIYTVTVTDANGCIRTDQKFIEVFIDRHVFVPNVFSPNGDQVNDYFIITPGSGLHEIEELTIYDRWGSIIFQEFHFQPDDPAYQWDGTMRGKPLNPGVYVYKLKVVYEDLRSTILHGDVTLLR
jgi:gliding motility-associated-like protein